MSEFALANEEATQQLARRLAPCLTFPFTLTLSGEIGSGKTCFIRALFQALGVQGVIKSPTFSLVESYQQQNLLIHHFDLYRIHDETELEYIGFNDFFTEQAFCCIEWPERAPHSVKNVDVQAVLTLQGDGRLMHFYAATKRGETVLSCLAGQQ